VREQTRRTKSTRAFLAKRVTQTRLVSRSVARVYRLRVHASLFERRHVHLLLFSIFSLLLLLLKLLLLGRRIIIITIVLIIISSAAMTTVYGRRRRAVVHRRRHPDMFVMLLLLQKLLLSVIIIICSSSSSAITRSRVNEYCYYYSDSLSLRCVGANTRTSRRTSIREWKRISRTVLTPALHLLPPRPPPRSRCWYCSRECYYYYSGCWWCVFLLGLLLA